ncbi:unnamed protein product [Eruca vesicaria subsp. sativa]|uniref:Small auxin-up RNA n=1 Tax=Eruca vesicaria subsp. sativa TaxID=29727 RepID=A0ABC8LM31_ERUVS|nr:unnamed protein product [Eruca vesicaria subsp. sativa]
MSIITKFRACPKGPCHRLCRRTYGKKRLVIPITYFNHPFFRDFLRYAEEEFGFNHPMGGLTFPCREEIFCSHYNVIVSQLY